MSRVLIVKYICTFQYVLFSTSPYKRLHDNVFSIVLDIVNKSFSENHSRAFPVCRTVTLNTLRMCPSDGPSDRKIRAAAILCTCAPSLKKIYSILKTSSSVVYQSKLAEGLNYNLSVCRKCVTRREQVFQTRTQ